MANLHAALHNLGPVNFTDVPTSMDELDKYISELFESSQLIVESIPIASPDEIATRARSATVSSIASNASEMSGSSARSAPPVPEYAALQKEWGKPVKLSAKENPLDMSVYKLGGKDGRGAWFARRSVHEGLGFARFKRGLEREFPESLAVQGAPGEGNIRGIGGEKRLESIQVNNKGKVEVYHLSAQFPGPTTPRDFVTFLVTSSKAMKDEHQSGKLRELSPRHFMVISKPCDHPETPAGKHGMIRGSYESVEFIREVPRAPKRSLSGKEPNQARNPSNSVSLGQAALLRKAQHNVRSFPLEQDSKSSEDLSWRTKTPHEHGNRRHTSSSPGRKRSVTVGVPDGPTHNHEHEDPANYDPESNPVEWIMITRSDPGGSVPRFMVERGTPSSIVADASKFLDWACQKVHPSEDGESEIPAKTSPKKKAQDLEGIQRSQTNGRLAGITEQDTPVTPHTEEPFPDLSPPSSPEDHHRDMGSSGIFGKVGDAVSSTLGALAPQVVLDHLPASLSHPHSSESHNMVPHSQSTPNLRAADPETSSLSSVSTTSFASADSHLGEGEVFPSISSKTSPEKDNSGPSKYPSQHEKELQKLHQRRTTLDAKLLSQREKLSKDTENQTAKERETLKKAEEKHEREMKKQEEKYKKEVQKLEAKKQKEAAKLEERRKRQADKDESGRLMRERDEARAELDLLKKEKEIFVKQVGALQAENTNLMARIGRLEGGESGSSKSSIKS